MKKSVDGDPVGGISRRSFAVGGVLLTAAGLASGEAGAAGTQTTRVAGGALKSPASAIARFPTTYMPAGGTVRRQGQILGSPAGGQHALVDLVNPEFGLRQAVRDGHPGVEFQMKDTGYRGIPLWAVREIDIALDGQKVPQTDLVFTLNDHKYAVADLSQQVGVQWWMFDWATIFVPLKQLPSPGSHALDVRFAYVSLYGRKPTDLAVLTYSRSLDLALMESNA